MSTDDNALFVFFYKIFTMIQDLHNDKAVFVFLQQDLHYDKG